MNTLDACAAASASDEIATVILQVLLISSVPFGSERANVETNLTWLLYIDTHARLRWVVLWPAPQAGADKQPE